MSAWLLPALRAFLRRLCWAHFRDTAGRRIRAAVRAEVARVAAVDRIGSRAADIRPSLEVRQLAALLAQQPAEDAALAADRCRSFLRGQRGRAAQHLREAADLLLDEATACDLSPWQLAVAHAVRRVEQGEGIEALCLLGAAAELNHQQERVH